ncbi:sulfatase family protein [Saccharicrinis fermentans]|uniref:sulfatase family protein n=1 Tax=Saccharicrinis fermentans TaxID=982 RepID=UPI0004AF97FC|nr:sulfatase [Saccharicrinis fermentans]
MWIVAEDLSPYMGCYGDSINEGHTPVIDKLAASGTLFTKAYAPAPVCSPCRSAFITGVSQIKTGTNHHRSSRTTDGEVVPEALRINLPNGMKTIPQLMKDAGYFTFNSGKDDYNFHYNRLDLYDVGSEDDYKPGMNGWQGNHAKAMMSVTEGVWSARKDKDQAWFGQVQIMGGKADYKYVREGERLAPDEVPLPPYFPNIPSQRKAWADHYNANRGSDVRIESILKQLELDGEMENTIIFFFSDHGSPTSLHHKQFCYEDGMHVPLIIKGKGIEAGVIRDELVSLLDVSATTLALGGAEMPAYLDGQNLLDKNFKSPEYIFGARDRCDFTIDRIRTARSEKYRYIRNFFPERPLMQPGYRDLKPIVTDLKNAYKNGELTPYQEKFWFGVRPEEELYDIAADPFEMHNLALDSAYQDVLKQHRIALNNWLKECGDNGDQENAVQLKATYDL